MSFDVAATRQASSVSTPVREGAKALISTDERVLLVKERHTDGEPFWTLPGGGPEPGETYVEAIERELAEELRCRVLVGEPITSVVYSHHTSDIVSTYTVVHCMLVSSPKPNVAEGILDAQWVRPGTMPPRTLPQVRSLWW
jgi:8-oxo-dGTP diphosphatase